VGYFASHADLTNDFQLTLTKVGNDGDFNIEFRYNRLEWTSGDASGGTGGLVGDNGIPAQAGYDAGDGEHFLALPGSFDGNFPTNDDILQLVNTTNSTEAGLWQFSIRDGAIADGSSDQRPLDPTIVQNGAFIFDFMITGQQTVYIDPLIAIGYDYQVLNGPNILGAIFPILNGQGLYSIYTLDGLTLLGQIAGGQFFNFGGAGVMGFRLLGINQALMLDPGNAQAFVTGLVFNAGGGTTSVQVAQTPLTFDTDGGAVPEPASWVMMILGFGGIGALMRRRRLAAA